MKTKFFEIARRYFEESHRLLQGWIRIDSVYDETTRGPGKPFGQGVDLALKYIGAIASADGFDVDYSEGYATEISFGRGPIIGVYAHADIVPISGTWKHAPFGGEIADGAMYGRGASDDKGPAIASYLAMKMLKDNGLISGYRARLVIGGNEERGSTCLQHYFHVLKKPQARAGFTPDGEFPLIYGEKGISNYRIAGELKLGPVHRIEAGVVSNSVIDKASAIINEDHTIETAIMDRGYRYEIGHADGKTKITILGKAAHGSLPELGVNAGVQLLELLGAHYRLKPLQVLASQYADPFGRTLGQYHESTLLHHTTYNVGLISYENGQFAMVVNFRYPETLKFEETMAAIEKISPLPLKVLMRSRPLLMDPNSPMVQTLLHAYQTETGDLVTPMMTIGGGTYAKEAENTVAFGSNFPDKQNFIHESDEKIDLADLETSIAIYARAIHDLGKLHAAAQ